MLLEWCTGWLEERSDRVSAIQRLAIPGTQGSVTNRMSAGFMQLWKLVGRLVVIGVDQALKAQFPELFVDHQGK